MTTPNERIHKLEALLERVLRNRKASARRGSSPQASAHAPSPAAPARSLTTQVSPAIPAASPAASTTPASPPVAAAPKAATPPAPPVTIPSEPPPQIIASEPPPVATTTWTPEPISSVQPRPVSAAPESLPPQELSDADLVEVTSIPPEAPAAPEPELVAAAQEITEPEAAPEPPILEPDMAEVSEVTIVSEEPPASSSRSKVSEQLDEALAAAPDADSELDVPVKTPPPESGPQEALPAMGLEAGRTPDVAVLEAELDGPPSMGPTAEQLGETIELEAPRGPELEIDVELEEPSSPVELEPAEELEATLPRPSMQSGLFDLTAQHGAPAVVEASPVASTLETRTAPEAATSTHEQTQRPALGATDVARVTLARASAPRTFLELLDASLGL